MTAQDNINLFVQKYLAPLCIVFLFAGLASGESAARMASAIPWLLAVLTFNSGLGLRLQDLASLRRRPWVLPLYLALLHVGMPLIAMGLSSLLGFPADAVMGFVILAVILLSASGVVWVGIYRGNLTLAMSLLLVDMLLAPFIIPYALELLFGASVHLDPMRMLKSLFWMLLFPMLLALFLNRVTSGGLQRVAGSAVSLSAKMSMFMLLFINGGVVAPFFHDFDLLFFELLFMVLFFCCFWFFLSFCLGRLVFADDSDVVAFMYSSSIRGTATGIVIAMTFFPPLTTLVVVMNLLFQQTMGSFAGRAALAYLEKKNGPGRVPAGKSESVLPGPIPWKAAVGGTIRKAGRHGFQDFPGEQVPGSPLVLPLFLGFP